MVLGKVQDSVKIHHINICIYFVLQANIDSVPEILKQNEEESKEEANKLDSTLITSNDKPQLIKSFKSSNELLHERLSIFPLRFVYHMICVLCEKKE